MGEIISIGPWEAVRYDSAQPDGILPPATGEWFSAQVPGAIQYDLAAGGKLENPYASTKAAFDAAWVAKSDWLYRAAFESPAPALGALDGGATVLLRMKGVDTYAEIWLNGALLGETANAMRIYEFPLRRGTLVPAGKNTLLVRVKSHQRMIAGKIDETEKHLHNGRAVEGTLGKSLIRRYQRSFFAGSSLLNLGTGVLGIGINREVELVVHPGPYISDCFFRTEALENGKARGTIRFSVEKAGPGTRVRARIIDREGKTAASAESLASAVSSTQGLPVIIEKPELWQPAGYGKPYLYTLEVELEEGGKTFPAEKREIGIRTVELVQRDETGKKTFYFKINGQKIIVHGENHIPLDYIKSYRPREEYQRLFRLLENQNVNMIRMWGGGVVEDDFFYAQCDRKGILIWHDMFLHSNVYPDYDQDFVKEFLAECQGVIRQVRPHPCFCLICGGNEQQEGWDEWGWKQSMDRFYGEKLIREYLPPLAAELCPDLPYIYNSPHGGKWAQSPVEGECHNWGSFYNSTKDPLFVTETCWTTESYSRPETLKEYMGLDVDAPEFAGPQWAERWRERTGLPLLNRMPYSNWFEVETLRSYLHGLELEQLRADYSALSMYRFRGPSNNGVIYWSHNKGGPLFQFGCVDYGGRPLMPYYAVKRVFAPLAVHAYRDVSDMVVMLSNHSAERVPVTVEITHLGKAGELLGSWTETVRAEPGVLLRVKRLEGLYTKVRDRTGECFHAAAFREDGPGKTAAGEDLFFFCPFSEYDGVYRPLKTGVEKTGPESWLLRLEAETPARLVELESDARLLFEDNYFPLVPGKPKTVEVSLLEKTAAPVRVSAGILGAEEARELSLS